MPAILQLLCGWYGLPTDTTIEVLLCSLEEIQRLNLEHMGRDEATDVLSFPSGMPQIEGAPYVLGSICYCPEKLEAYQETENDILAHAMLHLMGFDHDTDPQGWDTQEALQTAYLVEQGITVQTRRELVQKLPSTEVDQIY